MAEERAARRFFFILLSAATVLLAAVVKPLASALFLGAVFAGVLWPLHKKFSKKLRGRRAVSAGVFVAGVVLVIVGPLIALSAVVVKEASEGLKFVSTTVRSEGVTGLVERLPPAVQKMAKQGLARLPGEAGGDLDQTVQNQVSSQGGKAALAVGAAVKATGSLVFQAAMMLIALFFLLVEGGTFVKWLDSVSPLRPGQTHEILNEFKKVSYAVIMSTVITAAVQAAAALIGYFIARVPNPLFFAGMTFFVAFIPAVGAASVCLVAAGFLFVTGHPYMALFLALWGVIVVGLVDNVVKPLLARAGMEMHGSVVFFALIGGLGAFGTVGLLIGPLAVALFLTLLRIYQRDFKGAPAPGHEHADAHAAKGAAATKAGHSKTLPHGR
ncbi:MAG: AI-2E family transporter [Pseudomonadota bacterium]